ncbi:hypothetical protein CEXT_340401 [Caerostris extrusa]|uniref:Uncharacterized protein n=1 Tax=Caerostris extrusa TaxID=172846 RepID=A0AAV4M4D9_CAEEX|nr:hypothetical protein CEXT_340401 [Caerostris extrusa]
MLYYTALLEHTTEKILTEIMKVLMSKKSFQLDRDFSVQVIIAKRSVGARRSKITNISLDRLRNIAILLLPTDDDNLCCAKAIVIGLAHATMYTNVCHGKKIIQR